MAKSYDGILRSQFLTNYLQFGTHRFMTRLERRKNCRRPRVRCLLVGREIVRDDTIIGNQGKSFGTGHGWAFNAKAQSPGKFTAGVGKESDSSCSSS